MKRFFTGKRLFMVFTFTGLYILLVIIMHRLGVGCIFRYFFKIPCPGCGMTHAVVALLHLDFRAAFSYHPMVFSLPLIYLYILTNGRLFGKKALDITVISLLVFGFLLNYLYKIL